jgi:hypothetical protein
MLELLRTILAWPFLSLASLLKLASLPLFWLAGNIGGIEVKKLVVRATGGEHET